MARMPTTIYRSLQILCPCIVVCQSPDLSPAAAYELAVRFGFVCRLVLIKSSNCQAADRLLETVL